MVDRIVLTGFMGTGKTAVGRALAEQLGWRFVDTDELIEARTGQSIAAIFATAGEAAFRSHEAAVAQELAGTANCVIATGGRLMLDPANAAALERDAHLFCLTATPATILERLAGDRKRPLLDATDPADRINALLAERAAGYGRFLQVATDGRSIAEIVNELAGWLAVDRLTVGHDRGHYPVIAGAGLLPRWRELTGVSGAAVVVTDKNVGPHYASQLGDDVWVRSIQPGEQLKTIHSVGKLYGDLVYKRLDRQVTIIALGGGVIGDLAGFVAATYLRGVNFVQMPTSLLAMVDASVGGKVGVDLRQGKNLVGAFKQPLAVLADVATLATLPEAEVRAGLAETVKHGLIADAGLLEQLTSGLFDQSRLSLPGAVEAQLAAFQSLIIRAIRVKRNIVEADPYEHGQRALLNLGHTFAHAIEQESLYAIGHGEAVAMGLAAAADLSIRLGHAPAELRDRIETTLARLGLPTRIPANLAPANLLKAMGQDKKRAGGQLRFVLLRDVEEVFVSGDVPETAVLDTLTTLTTGQPFTIPESRTRRIRYSQLSRMISRALRHQPGRYGLTLDEEGWVAVDELLATMRKRRREWRNLTEPDLHKMIETSNKRRYEIREGRIRALYGHTVPDMIRRETAVPPATLYHGTSPTVIDKILEEGLRPMRRQYVHLSTDVETATQVGRRRASQPAILVVAARDAHEQGIPFYAASDEQDGTWLAEPIPPAFVRLLEPGEQPPVGQSKGER